MYIYSVYYAIVLANVKMFKNLQMNDKKIHTYDKLANCCANLRK